MPPSRFKTERETAFNGIFFAISKRLNNVKSLPRVLHSLAFQQMRKVVYVVYVIAVDIIMYSIEPFLPPSSLYLLCRQDRFL